MNVLRPRSNCAHTLKSHVIMVMHTLVQVVVPAGKALVGVAHHLVAIVPVDDGFPAARASNATHPLLLIAPAAATATGLDATRATKHRHDVLVSVSLNKTDKPSHGVESATTALKTQANSTQSTPSQMNRSRARQDRVLNSVVAWVSVVTWESTPEISAIDWQNVAPSGAFNVYRQVRCQSCHGNLLSILTVRARTSFVRTRFVVFVQCK